MAVYSPDQKNRNLLIGVGVSILVLGMILGFFIGKAGAPSFSGKVSELRKIAEGVSSDLDKLADNYKDPSAESSFSASAEVSSKVADLENRLEPALGDALWAADSQRKAIAEALDAIRDGARREVEKATFDARVREAKQLIAAVFGIEPVAEQKK